LIAPARLSLDTFGATEARCIRATVRPRRTYLFISLPAGDLSEGRISSSVTVDTREVQPHDTGEKEQLGLASVKVEPGSTSATTTSSTGTRLLHGILSQHPQQHGLGLQNGYGRHLAGHAQMGQPPYTTAAIATTSTPGKGSQALTGMRSDEISADWQCFR
jgi:hypothetical protein